MEGQGGRPPWWVLIPPPHSPHAHADARRDQQEKQQERQQDPGGDQPRVVRSRRLVHVAQGLAPEVPLLER